MPTNKSSTPTFKVVYATGIAAAALGGTSYQSMAANKTDDNAHIRDSRYDARATETVMAYDERLIDAKLEAVEARTETKFAQLMGKLELLSEKISGVSADIGELKSSVAAVDKKTTNTRVIVVTTVLGAFIAVAGIVYTIAAYSVALADFIKGQ